MPPMPMRRIAGFAAAVLALAGCAGNATEGKSSVALSSAATASVTSAKLPVVYAETENVHGTGYSVDVPHGFIDGTEQYQRDYPDAKFDLYVHWPSSLPGASINESFAVSREDSATCQDLICKSVRRLGGWNDAVRSDIESRQAEVSGKSVTAIRVRPRITVDGQESVWMSKDSPTAAIETVFTYHDGFLDSFSLKMPPNSTDDYRDRVIGQMVDSWKWSPR